jgi:hypothetical protein
MRKRSSYRPKHAANPLAYMTAIQGAHKLCADDQLTRAARVRCSVEDLCASRGDHKAWADVFDTVNMIEALSREGLFRHAREFIEAQQQNIVDAMDRHKATGSNVLRPVECQMLRELAQVWAEALGEVTCREYFAAEERVRRKVTAVLRGKPVPGVRVLEAA